MVAIVVVVVAVEVGIVVGGVMRNMSGERRQQRGASAVPQRAVDRPLSLHPTHLYVEELGFRVQGSGFGV